jgi:hypothetical protein
VIEHGRSRSKYFVMVVHKGHVTRATRHRESYEESQEPEDHNENHIEKGLELRNSQEHLTSLVRCS